ALAVEAVLVALVEPAQRLVSLEDVFQSATPGMVDAHRVVRGDRPVEEAEALAAAILLPQLVEDPLAVPPGEDVLLQGGVVGNLRELRERLGHRVRFYGRAGTAFPPRALEKETNRKELECQLR